MSEEWDKEKGQLLSIFSAEVWLLVLGNVKNSTDFQRISNASPYFRPLLQPRAVQALFPEVLQVLMKQQPQLLAHQKELLPLRRVCHAWKWGVEHALHDHHYMLLSKREKDERQDIMKPKLLPPWEVHPYVSTFERFRRVEDFARFQQHFGAIAATAQSNPFFCHFIHLTLPWISQVFPPYLEACLEFLQIYGGHFRYCYIVQNFEDEVQYRQFYATGLKKILALMPNLKVCHFMDYSHPRISRPEVLQLAVEESLTPMPELRQLQKISLTKRVFPFFKALVQKNPQVSIVSDDWATEQQVQFYLGQMPNLTRLEVELHDESPFHAFERTEILKCQLSTLHLTIYENCGKNWLGEMGLRRLFSMLEARFSATLTELRLEGKPMAAEADGLTLELPHLKKFALILQGPIIPLEFMLPLQNKLEELTLGSYGYRRSVRGNVRYQGEPEAPFSMKVAQEVDETIRLYQFWVEPQNSNVWALFPKLKLLRTEGVGRPSLCTQDKWIAVQSQND